MGLVLRIDNCMEIRSIPRRVGCLVFVILLVLSGLIQFLRGVDIKKKSTYLDMFRIGLYHVAKFSVLLFSAFYVSSRRYNHDRYKSVWGLRHCLSHLKLQLPICRYYFRVLASQSNFPIVVGAPRAYKRFGYCVDVMVYCVPICVDLFLFETHVRGVNV